jgi:Domain of unknown function (DUF397)
VQETMQDAQWRKSSYSGNTGNCVEVAVTESVVGVRDSKNPDGRPLAFAPDEWLAFTAGIKAGDFDLS